ncbi:TonB-dependent receptor [Sphingomonas sabuli]|uniref:TonB-dependent receptor n=1 Tax=Sphingomonas sabuli TaxID=2764186 RepID=A0A7G9L3Z9_9SPHN|nr:TonB-dependent receptor [Sphingomonas sabuli]QNM83348.1 TonB-dependent receptor [Sphingomonas sabuli]
MRYPSWSTSLTSLALALAAAPAAAAAQPGNYALPSMSLGAALREVARQNGIDLLVDDRLVAGRRAPPLSGAYSVESAIAALLQGSGLTSRQVDGTWVISASEQPEGPGDAGALADNEDVIVVTGTNVRGAQPTSPVITISRADIDRAQPGSAEELMRKLPQNVASGVAQENFGTTGAGADITDHGAGVNLRGLGQRATLTLLNGRRLAPSGSGSFVDISLIPITAVQRVEIVTDGASAIYGSDAVGGVVNFILRRDFDGLETVAQAGTTTQGGGDQLLLGATGGRRWTGGHGLLSYEYRRDRLVRADQRDFTLNLPDEWSLFPDERRHSLFGAVGQEISPTLSIDANFLYTDRRTARSFFIAGPVVPVDARARARTIGGTAALRWTPIGDWTVEASAGWYRARTDEQQNQPQGQGLFNRFDTENRILELGLKADGTIVDLPGGPLKLALGAAHRREAYASEFETQVNPVNPQSGKRRVSSLYGEIYTPLVGEANRLPLVEKLIVTAAARLEHYSNLKTSVDPKLGLLWSPGHGLDLRASYSTSFRAPLLSEQLGFYNAFLFPSSLLYIDPSEAIPGVGAALVGANPDVGPEKSRSWTAGFDWKPPSVPGLSLTASYYAIRFTNRIALPTEQIVIVGDPALAPAVTLNPDVGYVTAILDGAGNVLDFSGPGFTNGNATPADVVVIVDARVSNTAETRTNGLDLGLRYDWTLGRHQLRFDLNANKVFRFDDRLTTTSPAIKTVNTPFHPIDLRFRAGLGWSLGPWAANAALNYTDGYRDNRAGRDDKVDSFTTVDAGLVYDFGTGRTAPLDRLRIAFNVQNLFDQDPPSLGLEPGQTRGIGFDPVNATGRGRFVSLQLRKSW